MKRQIILIIVFILFCNSMPAQDYDSTAKKIRIPSASETTINQLVDAGIDLQCGAMILKNSIALELSAYELGKLRALGIPFTVEIDDLTSYYEQRALEKMPMAIEALEQEKLQASSRETYESTEVLNNPLQYTDCDEVDWAVPANFNLGSMGGCMTVSEVEAELDDMRSLYPSLISVKQDASPTNQTTYGNTLGSSGNQWPGQTVYYVRITGNQASAEGTKPQILYTSMIHSREVGSLMSNLYFMWYLLENYASDSAVKELVDNNELYFIPVVNPDGLRWNETIAPGGGGMQRKNLRVNAGDSGSTSTSNTSRGVDLNRNFDYFWGSAGTGSSGSTGSDSYRGPSAASEPETQILVDFILARDFKTCIMNHTYSNAIPHPYGGNPGFVSGREDEMHKWHEDMTRYNRYISGATVFTPANGIADDWMVGGNADANGSTGSGKNILATTPEHGHGTEGGFWPDPTNIVPISKRAMRIYFMTAYYGGKYARFHDLTQADIATLTSDLTFGIERLGQTDSDFTLTVTPVSSNIVSISTPAIQSGMSILEQRNVTAQLTLNSSIQPNDKIEYKIQLANTDGVFYEANIKKYYQPAVLLADDPDTNGISNWTSSGNWQTTTSSAWSGTTAIKDSGGAPYASNETSTLTTGSSYNLNSYDRVLVQFYTKWDIERNFDFVELLGSSDGGTSWQVLCGQYNKPAATSETNDSHVNKSSSNYAFQENNSSGRVYDGDQMDNWVMEEIVIDSDHNTFMNNSSSAQFRFRFRSDSDNVGENYSAAFEGFYLDDFKVIGLQIPCDNSAAPANLTVSAVTSASVNLTWDNVPSATYDLRYRKIGASGWTTINGIAANNYIISGLDPSTNYEAQVATRCGAVTSSFSLSVNFTTLDTVPCTGNSVAIFPYAESFESGLQLWSQGTNGSEDDIDWTLQSNQTPSGSTGPDAASDGSQYLYTEASTNVSPPGNPNKSAYLISPCFDFSNHEDASITFDYHMYGSDMGTLSLELSIDDGATYTTIFSINGQQQTGMSDSWTTQVVDLSLYDGQVIKLRFNGQTGSGYRSDMAIDKVQISATELTLNTDLNVLSDLTLYPNPFQDTLIILCPASVNYKGVNIELLDIQGRIIVRLVSMKPTHGKLRIQSMDQLSNGSYFIKITDVASGDEIIKHLVKK